MEDFPSYEIGGRHLKGMVPVQYKDFDYLGDGRTLEPLIAQLRQLLLSLAARQGEIEGGFIMIPLPDPTQHVAETLNVSENLARICLSTLMAAGLVAVFSDRLRVDATHLAEYSSPITSTAPKPPSVDLGP